ncbi:MAG: c-type cytochrome [Propionivibrio sp.]
MDNNKPHSSRTIMWITVAVAAVLVLIVWPLSMIGKAPTDGSGDDAELRIQPVARIEMQKAAPVSDGKPRSGEAVYNTICQACHAAGVAGAPKTGDKAAWAPRIATGIEALLKSATNGKNAMPARGGAADLTDDELKAAVDYLIEKAK